MVSFSRLSKVVFIALFLLQYLIVLDSHAQETSYKMEPLVVTGSRIVPGFSARTRVVSTLNREKIKALPVASLQEVLGFLPGVDLKSRNPFGIQGDVSIRGSTFSQVLILVDGIRVNDPQTGHHNLNVPVPLENIERIEVLQGPASSVYGADAVGGVINIITRKPTKNSLDLEGTRGENNTWGGTGALNLRKKRWFSTCSFDEDSSSGYGEDTDYQAHRLSAKIGWSGHTNSFNLSYGYLDKGFGAYDFYTPGLNFPSREWNRSQMVMADASIYHKRWIVKPTFLYRHHFDEFWLDQERPSFYKNKTKTDLFGGGIETNGSLGSFGSAALGFEVQGDTVTSTGLGNHDRQWFSWFGEWSIERSDKFYLDLGFRFDKYSDFAPEFNPSLAASFKPNSHINLRASVGRSFRIPSYTELYYDSPSNKGNSDLDPEHAWSVDAGIDATIRDFLSVSLTFFYRKESDIIDWVRYPGEGFFQVVNSDTVETWGVEPTVKCGVGKYLTLSLSYDFLDKSIETSANYQSKYVLNYPRNQFKALALALLPFNSSLTLSTEYQGRKSLGHFWIMDGRIGKKFRHWQVYFSGTNLTDESYQLIRGIDQPGRRLEIGVRTIWDF